MNDKIKNLSSVLNKKWFICVAIVLIGYFISYYYNNPFIFYVAIISAIIIGLRKWIENKISTTDVNTVLFLKIISRTVLVIVGLILWYISIPIITIWYLYKKNQKFSSKTKLIISVTITVVFLISGGVYSYFQKAPILTIVTPENNTSIQAEKIEIRGNVSPVNSIIKINEIEVETKLGSFVYEYRLNKTNENNNITIKAVNNRKEDAKNLSIKKIFTEEELAEIEKQKEEARLAQVKQIKERLQREIDSLNKPFDNSMYRKDNLSLSLELALFGGYAKIINEYKSNKDEGIQSLLRQLENKVSQLQVIEFPKMRRALADFIAETMWEYNMTVVAGGTSNKSITFTASMYANNKNIKDSYSALQSSLKSFRFTRANYKWYKYDDEYSYYDIDSHPDSKVTIDN
jgi:hypothetical protein